MSGLNRDDILRMAREVGLIHYYDSEGHWSGVTNEPLIEQDANRNDDRLVETLAPFAALVAAAEREACAKLADDKLMDTSALMSFPPKSSAAWSIAAAIRARGNDAA